MGPAARQARFSRRPHARAPHAQYDFVADVSALLSVGQEVDVWVLNVDAAKKRFGLTLKAPGSAPPPREPREPRGEAAGDAAAGERRGKVATRGVLSRDRKDGGDKPERKAPTVKKGDWVDGKVLSVLPYGAVVEVEEGVSGLLHVSEMSGACVHARHPPPRRATAAGAERCIAPPHPRSAAQRSRTPSRRTWSRLTRLSRSASTTSKRTSCACL